MLKAIVQLDTTATWQCGGMERPRCFKSFLDFYLRDILHVQNKNEIFFSFYLFALFGTHFLHHVSTVKASI